MHKFMSLALGTGLVFFGAFSSSSTYSLQSYGVGGGGTNSSASTNYHLQGNVGETSGAASNSTNDAANSGGIKAQQANVPPAPTLSNGGGIYYNKLQVTLATGGNPSDATFAIAASTDNFTTTHYVQSDGTLGSTQYFQTYSAWGGSGGTTMVGLTPGATYEVKVSAMTGQFTQSAYGPYATSTLATPSITFSLSPTSQNIGTLLPGTVVTGGSTVGFGLTTNASYGGIIYVAGQFAGLRSASKSYTIPAVSANLSSQTQGFGVQGASASSPLVIASPFNGTGNTVGGETTSLVPIFVTPSAISSGTATANIQAKASSTTPASSDYQEVLTFVAAASF